MNDIKVCLDKQSFAFKPPNEDAARISNRIGKSIKQLNSENLRSFALDVSCDGYTFCPATFKGGIRNKKNFKQQQLFALDFDGGITLQEVYDRTEKYDLPILFAYETFSSKNKDKFRVVFLNDVSVTDIRIAEIIQNALITIFTETDKTCKDISKMYYGGKKLLKFDSSIPEINIELLIRNMTIYLRNKYGDTHYKEHLKKFAQSNGIALNNKGMLDISIVEDNSELLFTNKITKNKFSTENTGANPSNNENGKISPNTIIVNSVGGFLPKLKYLINLRKCR